jgi:hypothetical protein
MLKPTTGLVLAAYAGLVLAQGTRVPEPFWGRWDSSAETCGKGGDGRLTITATQIEFYASHGRVLAVHVNGLRDILVEYEALGEEGGTTRASRRFVLSEDGQTITNILNERTKFSRVRCN